MKYRAAAPDSLAGWENASLPLGCGHFGVNVFGGVARERLQITENSVLTRNNLTNAVELYLRFPHGAATDYERGLVLDTATAYCRYTCDGVGHARECFASYPDGVLALKLTADRPGALSFTLAPEIPFVRPFGEGDGSRGRTGAVRAHGNAIELESHLEYYGILLSAELRVVSDGQCTAGAGVLDVVGATEAVVYFACGTNYVLEPRVFCEPDPRRKLDPVSPQARVAARVKAAVRKGYAALRADHVRDHAELFGRVDLDLGHRHALDDGPTDELLQAYARGEPAGYLEEVYFQYGRYLLIASSRAGCLPANLQGVWNAHDQSPWGSGYWHNINVQMNYWPVFSTNLAELFPAYSALNEAFRPQAGEYAVAYVRGRNQEHYRAGEDCGWCIGTAVYPYEAGGAPGGHSGPGTGGLTTKMYWDWWDFTRDQRVLQDRVYPALHGMGNFLTRTVRDYDGLLLAAFSASPEQMLNGPYVSHGTYYHSVGCAFDQQMIYENGRDLLACARLLGATDAVIRRQQEQFAHYDPIQIGWSGQIKEYREENYYGEIGEYQHRHISQLVALMPGTLITRETPAWLDAAKVTLNERSDQSTGWALAHRLNAWARTGDGDRAYRLLRSLLGTRTLPNLWDTHPPFQIDGNFGGTAGIAEMLLQSHDGCVSVLPALPSAWHTGRFAGLVARGNFTVGAAWRDGHAERITVHANVGGRLVLRYPQLARASVRDGGGVPVAFAVLAPDRVAVETVPGGEYVISAIPQETRVAPPGRLTVDPATLTLRWPAAADPAACYLVYRNTRSAPTYERIAGPLAGTSFTDGAADFAAEDYITYKVTACRADGSGESDGPVRTICHATRLYRERHLLRIKASSRAEKTLDEL